MQCLIYEAYFNLFSTPECECEILSKRIFKEAKKSLKPISLHKSVVGAKVMTQKSFLKENMKY